ncbi:MAG: hypothetical protein RLY97_1179 [Pseudomonadota bacterium]|jgi:membrane-bound lytic murein transglycosylase B
MKNRGKIMILGLAVSAALIAVPQTNLYAQSADTAPADNGFQAYVAQLGAQARAAGVSAATVQAYSSALTYNLRVVALDRAQPEISPSARPPAFAPYRAAHVDADRIIRGRAIYADMATKIPEFEQKYGVPASIILSIWGNETSYGRVKGGFDLPNSLATLAYDGRRRALFAGEFIALLKMADQGVPRDRMVGSWAGAFGNPQFLPSVYLRLAQDGDGDGVRDIWSNRADTMASIANYFRDSGWRPGLPWGVGAYVPADLDRSTLIGKLDSPVCKRVHSRRTRWLTVKEWRAKGVIPQGNLPDSTMAALIEPDGIGKNAYLLTGNYRVILEYNCSNYYALSVGLLADEIAK